MKAPTDLQESKGSAAPDPRDEKPACSVEPDLTDAEIDRWLLSVPCARYEPSAMQRMAREIKRRRAQYATDLGEAFRKGIAWVGTFDPYHVESAVAEYTRDKKGLP